MVFEVLQLRAKDIGRLLEHADDSDEVKRLEDISPDRVTVAMSPLEVIKYGRSMMASLFVGLVGLATGCEIRGDTVITGELGLW